MSKRCYTLLSLLLGSFLFAVFLFPLTVSAQDDTTATTVDYFIPVDSMVYIKLQNLSACQQAIKNSENWKQAAEIISAHPKWQAMYQLIQAMPTVVGTDLHTLIETFFVDVVAVTISPGPEGLMIGIVIKNTDKQHAASDIFSRFIERIAGVDGNEAGIDEATYRDIKYYTAHINTNEFNYGYVDENLFLVGITPGSFKKMVDTYNTEKTSITENTKYRSRQDQFGESEVFAFVDMEKALPFINTMLPSPVGNELSFFQSWVLSWDLLQTGGMLQAHGYLKSPENGSLFSRIQGDSEIQSLQGVSGKEIFSFAVAPSSVGTLFEMLLGTNTDTNPPPSNNTLSFLTLNKNDALDALIGEVVISVDSSAPYTLREHPTHVSTQSVDGIIRSIEYAFPEVDLGFIFKPDDPLKLQTLFDRVLEKLTIEPPKQFEYKNTKINTVSIPGALYYAPVKDFFVLAFSSKYCQSIIDTLLTPKSERPLDEISGRLLAHPTAIFQLNLLDLFNFIASTGEVKWLDKDSPALRKNIGILLATLEVDANAVRFGTILSPKEKSMDAIALLAPVIFMRLTEEMPMIQ